jgi:4-alpha-glucanotransferase
VIGAPAGLFLRDGPALGQPLYRWDRMAKMLRVVDPALRAVFKTVDFVRIDHFRGSRRIGSYPAEDETAINGSGFPAPAASSPS